MRTRNNITVTLLISIVFILLNFHAVNAAEKYSEEQLCDMALSYCMETTGATPHHVDSYPNDDGTVTIQLYNITEIYDDDGNLVDGHTATVDWYVVDYSGKGTNFMGEAIDIAGSRDKKWNEIYIDYLRNSEYYELDSADTGHEDYELTEYYVINIDDDDIPEIVCTGAYWYLGQKVLYINNGRVQECLLPGMCFNYTERTGYFSSRGGHTGELWDLLYKLKNGTLTCLVDASYSDYNENDYEDYTPHDFVWNGENVSEEEYNSRVKNEIESVVNSSQIPDDKIFIGTNNVIEYLENYPIDQLIFNGVPISEMFSTSSIEYNKNVALLAALLSKEAEDETGDRIRSLYDSLGIEYHREFQYTENDQLESKNPDGSPMKSRAFSFAYLPLSNKENLLIITARGSVNYGELWDDMWSRNFGDFYGKTANKLIIDFEEEIREGLDYYLDDLEDEGIYLENNKLKVLITGHSLGGAAANLVGAVFTLYSDDGSWWSAVTDKESIFCYTFGALDSISPNVPVEENYENIHNIYNKQDTFGPKRFGKLLVSGLGGMYGKYGHLDTFDYDYETMPYDLFSSRYPETRIVQAVNSDNHKMEGYIDAIDSKIDGCTHTKHPGSQFLIIVGCPVDVEVYKGGVLSGKVINETADVTDENVNIVVNDGHKYIYIEGNDKYDIRISGYDEGTMNVYVHDMLDSDAEPVVCENIPVDAETRYEIELNEERNLSNITINETDGDSWGKSDNSASSLQSTDANKTEQIKRIIIICISVSVLVALIFIFVILRKRRSSLEKDTDSVIMCSCGAQVPGNSVYCHKCGKKLKQ